MEFNYWYQVTMSGDWVPWSAKVPQVEVETHKVASPDIVVPTLDTVSPHNQVSSDESLSKFQR